VEDFKSDREDVRRSFTSGKQDPLRKEPWLFTFCLSLLA
jgi:hypothetical protein